LAIAVAISSNPSNYFVELVFNRMNKMTLSNNFVKPFLNRLLLEKADMNSNPIVSLALVFFYSIYIELNIAANLRRGTVDTLANEFVKVIGLVLRRNSLDVVRSNYEVTNEYSLFKKEKVFLMKRKKSGDKLLLGPTNLFPDLLYVHHSFLEQT